MLLRVLRSHVFKTGYAERQNILTYSTMKNQRGMESLYFPVAQIKPDGETGKYAVLLLNDFGLTLNDIPQEILQQIFDFLHSHIVTQIKLFFILLEEVSATKPVEVSRREHMRVMRLLFNPGSDG